MHHSAFFRFLSIQQRELFVRIFIDTDTKIILKDKSLIILKNNVDKGLMKYIKNDIMKISYREDSSFMRQKLFISYSHEDKEIVKQFALQLSLGGFDLWMDEKNVSFGGNYTTAILRGIHEANMYIVFLSENSIQSHWVNAEIDFALREKIERQKLVIIPVRLDDSEIPVELSNIDYVDARFSVTVAANEFIKKFGEKYKKNSDTVFDISSVSFEISDKTAVEISPFTEITAYDLKQNREQILKNLRKKAHGILMNFVSAEDFDFQSTLPKYKNGMYEESIQKISGSTNGSIGEEIRVEAMVFSPNEKKINRLLNERIEILNINAITFGISVPGNESESLLDIGKRCLCKLQEEYIILSYDNNEGAKVEIDRDFYLAFMPSESVLKIKLSTKYDFQFEEHMKKFSVMQFLTHLMGMDN